MGGGTDGQIEGCGENMTQPSMGEGSWQSESRREKFQETSREKLGMGRQGLRQRGNLIVTGKEESLLARGSSRDLRVRLLGSWATKGPVYIECSEGGPATEGQVFPDASSAQLEKPPVFAQASCRVCGALPDSWRMEKRARLATATGARSPFVRLDRQAPDMEHACSLRG